MQSKQQQKFWNFVAADATTEKPAELMLYGDIASSSWWGDEVTPRQFSDDLMALGEISELVVRINSGGGDVFAANAIYARLKDHPAKITVKIDGWAASAATIIAMAGDVIQIPANGLFMIHDPKMGIMGYYGDDEFEKFAEALTVTKNSIVNAYALKTGKNKQELSVLMSEETWYTGEEAVTAGFCDEVLFEESSENAVMTDFSRYKNMPTELLNRPPTACGGLTYPQNKESEDKNMDYPATIHTVEDLQKAYPELTKQIADTATTAERERIKDIEEISISGFEEVVSRAKFSSPATAAEVVVQIVTAQKKQGESYLEGVKRDTTDSGTMGVVAGSREVDYSQESRQRKVQVCESCLKKSSSFWFGESILLAE